MRSRVFPFGVFFLAGLASFGVIRDAAADDSRNYAELEKAALEGRDIGATFDLSRCLVHGANTPGPSIRGGLHLDGFMIQSDQTIAFSATRLTVRSDNTPVNGLLSFKVAPTGKIDVLSLSLNPLTYAIFHEAEFDCSMGEGVTFHW
ncbi:MAG: VirK family protein [Methylocella sp.]